MSLAAIAGYMGSTPFVRALTRYEGRFGSETLYAFESYEPGELDDMTTAVLDAVDRAGFQIEEWPHPDGEGWLFFSAADGYAGHVESSGASPGTVTIGIVISEQTPFMPASRAKPEIERMANGSHDPAEIFAAEFGIGTGIGLPPGGGTSLQPGGLPTVESVNPQRSKWPLIVGIVIAALGSLFVLVVGAAALLMLTRKKPKRRRKRR